MQAETGRRSSERLAVKNKQAHKRRQKAGRSKQADGDRLTQAGQDADALRGRQACRESGRHRQADT